MGVIVEINNSELINPNNNKDNHCVEKKINNSSYCEKSVKQEAKFCESSKEDKCVKDYLKSKMKGLKKLKKKMGFGKFDVSERKVSIFRLMFDINMKCIFHVTT